jgi:hypothetical protein
VVIRKHIFPLYIAAVLCMKVGSRGLGLFNSSHPLAQQQTVEGNQYILVFLYDNLLEIRYVYFEDQRHGAVILR